MPRYPIKDGGAFVSSSVLTVEYSETSATLGSADLRQIRGPHHFGSAAIQRHSHIAL